MRQPKLIDYLLLTLLALIWASAFFNIKIATYSFGPVTIAFLRVFFGAIPVLLLCYFKKIKIAICCDDEFGLDFNRILKITKLSKEEILNLSLNKEYFCYMTGFIAGMPFLGDINKDIRCNRLETPRLKVPKGSVGITEQFVNIYTFESPGGWNIIGNTPEKIFDNLNSKEPALIKPGDRVSFYQISKEEYLNWNE